MFLAKIVVAAGVLAGVLAMLAGPASAWLNATLAERVGRLALAMAAGGAAYFGALWLLGFRLKDFSRRDRIAAPAPAVEPDEG
jgi:putative peptidoglycan lipid II flippase